MKKSITIMLTAIFSLQLLSMVTFAEETVGAIENKTLGEMVVVDVVGEETPEVESTIEETVNCIEDEVAESENIVVSKNDENEEDKTEIESEVETEISSPEVDADSTVEESEVVIIEEENTPVVDYDSINRNVSEKLFNQATIVMEANDESFGELFSEPVYGDVETTSSYNNLSTEVYSTAPTMTNSVSLRVAESQLAGIRFQASVSSEQRQAAYEYGFLICTTSSLEESGTELTLDNNEITFLKGVAYNRVEGIDKIFSNTGDSIHFTGVLYNVPKENYMSYITARPYIIYEVDGELIYAYGETLSASIYRTCKELLYGDYDLGTETEDVLKGYIRDAENTIDLSDASEVDFEYNIERTIGYEPDIDLIKISPTWSSLYFLSLDSDEYASLTVFDASGSALDEIVVDRTTNEKALLLEKNQNYYVRVSGCRNTDYSLHFAPCVENAVILDFSSSDENITYGGNVSGEIENGLLDLTISNTTAANNSFFQMDVSGVDLFDYSKMIVRLRSSSECIGVSGMAVSCVGGNNYTFNYNLLANTDGFESVEFDLKSCYGSVDTLKVSLGTLMTSFSGNVCIDSIVLVPMPEVLGWEFDGNDSEGWSVNQQINSANVSDGLYKMSLLGNVSGASPAIMSSVNSAYDYYKYNTMHISLRNGSTASKMKVYFSTLAEGQGSYSESKTIVVEIEPNSDEFIEYTINLYEHAQFTDSLKGMMISIPGEGDISIDYIRLSKTEIEYDDLLWDFNDNSLQGFTTDNDRHVLSVEDGIMTVVSSDISSGGLYLPTSLNVPTSEYKYLVIGVNSASVDSDFEVYFKTNTMNSYRGNDSVNKVVYGQIIPIYQSNTFKEYVIDLSYAYDGWSSGYTGKLMSIMTAFKATGVFEIDYVKLTDGVNSKDFRLTAQEDKEYTFALTKNDAQTIGTYTLKYDADVFELVDACAMTYSKEIQEGTVIGTDIIITDVSDNSVTFTVSNKTIAGVINCFKFKAIASVSSTFSVITSIE